MQIRKEKWEDVLANRKEGKIMYFPVQKWYLEGSANTSIIDFLIFLVNTFIVNSKQPLLNELRRKQL